MTTIIWLALTALAWVDRAGSFYWSRDDPVKRRVPAEQCLPFPDLCEEKQIPQANHVSAADSSPCLQEFAALLLCQWGWVWMTVCASGSPLACWEHGGLLPLVFWLHLLRTSPTAKAAIFKQPEGTDLSVSAGECALQSSKPHIWVTHCMEWGSCVQLSQELDSYQMLGLGEKEKILKQ